MPPPTASLKGIPPEIRLNIYDYLLVSDKPIALRSRTQGLTTYHRYKLQPSIIRTSKLFNREVSNVLYAHNSFKLYLKFGPALAPQFLGPIGIVNLSMIRTITIIIVATVEPVEDSFKNIWRGLTNMVLSLTPRAHGLRTLRFEMLPVNIKSGFQNEQSTWVSNRHFPRNLRACTQNGFHYAVQAALHDALSRTGRRQSADLTGGGVSRVSTPTEYVTEAFELATVTWKQKLSGDDSSEF
ncbi:MAG: hypothetical protein M1836_000997 [Candelina mexicana]|nr:MAG: hypothetical protein M1836_000997 [Candelina mexicana]